MHDIADVPAWHPAVQPPAIPVGRRHVLLIIVEDYWHVGPASHVVSAATWYRFESRVLANTERTLDLLDAAGARATFFVLGWIAEHEPAVVRAILDRGHEVASKGYMHESIRRMPPAAFREDILRSCLVIEDAGGVAVRGYRTPAGGFGPGDLWALDVLAEEGFDYDASLRLVGLSFARQPIRRYIHRHECRNGRAIWQVPVSTTRVGPCLVPVGGGNYVRQLPDRLVRRAVARWVDTAPAPLVFYFHVWELDPEQPRIRGMPALERVRQYRHLGLMPARVGEYLRRYAFGSVAEYLGLDAPPVRRPEPVAMPAAAAAAAPGGTPPRQPISIVVPCYNEEAVLGYLANTLGSVGARLASRHEVSYVFVDDGSTDRTWQRLHQLFGDRADCTLLRHGRNRGIAAAVLTGIRQTQTEIVCCIDADGTFDPHQLEAMVPLLTDDVDIVTSTCFGHGGHVQNVPTWRLALSRGATWLYGRVLYNRLSHYTSCFRVYRRSAVVDIEIGNERYVGITEILARVDQGGGRIVEFPATLEVRVLGRSKMRILATVAGHLRLVASLAADRLRAGGARRPRAAAGGPDGGGPAGRGRRRDWLRL
jgi:polysaccharide deacetylase family protein (PEP-CTERM system associated)